MRVHSLNLGLPRPLAWQGRILHTSIGREPAAGPVALGTLGFAGDGQADLANHGGADKAVNAYFYGHYAAWAAELGRPLPVPSFGENLTLAEGSEDQVCIGDIYRIGTALLQVSQPRIPCHKLAAWHRQEDLPQQVVASGRTGFYLRVLAPGLVAPGDALELVRRPPGAPTVAWANRIRHHEPANLAGVQRLLAAEGLAAAWHGALERRLETGG